MTTEQRDRIKEALDELLRAADAGDGPAIKAAADRLAGFGGECRALVEKHRWHLIELRRRAGTPLVGPVTGERSYAPTMALARAGYLTLEELATLPRQDVAAIDGVGRTTMDRLDLALAERDLAYAA